jgi:hypothetical protein
LKRKNQKTIFSFQSMPNLDFAKVLSSRLSVEDPFQQAEARISA